MDNKTPQDVKAFAGFLVQFNYFNYCADVVVAVLVAVTLVVTAVVVLMVAVEVAVTDIDDVAVAVEVAAIGVVAVVEVAAARNRSISFMVWAIWSLSL